MEGWNNNLVGAVERAAKQVSSSWMKAQHNGTAAPLAQGKYKDEQGHKRQLDSVVVADSCVLVTEVSKQMGSLQHESCLCVF